MRSGEYEPGETDWLQSATGRRPPAWHPLIPASIVAVGNPELPAGRLLTLQSAIARGVHLAMSLDRLQLRLPLHSLLKLRFR